MVSSDTKWVQMFDAPEVAKHQRGFTIYKIISMLYPEHCPEAITKITVWKRFSDFKHLHKDMKNLHKALKIKDAYPSLSSPTYFKRFDDEVINQRKELILGYLEYISQHPQLFSSSIFVKFFEMSYSKNLGKPHKIGHDMSSLHSPDSEDDCAMSDSDSVSTINSSVIVFPEEPKIDVEDSYPIYFRIVISDLEIFKFELFATSADNLPSSLEYYVADAENFFSIAEQAEKDKEFKVAWLHYMQGAYILIKFGKEDSNSDRRLKCKFKLERFLIRLERLFYVNLFETIKIYMIENYGELFANLILNDLNNLHYEQLINMQRFEPVYTCDNDTLLLTLKMGSIVLLNYPVSNCGSKLQSAVRKCESDNFALAANRFESKQKLNAAYANYKMAFMDLLKGKENSKTQSFDPKQSEKKFDSTKSESKIKEKKSKLVLSHHYRYRDLYNYKVISVRDDSMILALQKDSQQTFIVEVIQKSHAYDSDNLVLPTNVPFMMKLQKWYETADAIFLIIKHTECTRLKEYVLNKFTGTPADETDTKELSQTDADYVFVEQPSVSELEDLEEYFENVLYCVPLEVARKWTAQLVVALEKLHKNGITFCNLSMDDLHVDDNEDICINFKYQKGSVKVDEKDAARPPEASSFGETSASSDWWSLGVILYELLVGMPLNRAHPEGIFNYTLLRFPRRVPYHSRTLVQQLLAFDPAKRLGADGVDHIKSHAFFGNLNWTTTSLQQI